MYYLQVPTLEKQLQALCLYFTLNGCWFGCPTCPGACTPGPFGPPIAPGVYIGVLGTGSLSFEESYGSAVLIPGRAREVDEESLE